MQIYLTIILQNIRYQLLPKHNPTPSTIIFTKIFLRFFKKKHKIHAKYTLDIIHFPHIASYATWLLPLFSSLTPIAGDYI